MIDERDQEPEAEIIDDETRLPRADRAPHGEPRPEPDAGEGEE